MLRLTRERVCETWEQIFCPACILLLFQAIYVLVHHWGVIVIFFFLTGTQFIGPRLEYTRSIDTRASPGKICQCEVQYIVFILVHNKTLQEANSSEYQKKANYFCGGSDYNTVARKLFKFEGLGIYDIDPHLEQPVEQAYCVWAPGILDELGRKGGKREASVRL